jgi:hypothetical protein
MKEQESIAESLPDRERLTPTVEGLRSTLVVSRPRPMRLTPDRVREIRERTGK